MAAGNEQAIVIGGSMAGMLAARVLADHFERVVILDRDHAAHAPVHRTGVPRGKHLHLLLAGNNRSRRCGLGSGAI
jgi:2-polyprenyl-6-methoxyphenol hydroxylase-like FAD-dependent oxidoreductase